ncbi:MAG: hypothetical protein IH859_02980, partial [Chloroflexi bacterium]|nr:hypothetical protein [Chloroflexota bacterium]
MMGIEARLYSKPISRNGQLMFRKALEVIKTKNLPIFILVTLNLLLGLIIVDDFGESWDEKSQILYAESSLSLYKTPLPRGGETYYGPNTTQYYGPSFIMFAKLTETGLMDFKIGWESREIFHFMYFVSFQIGLISIFAINKRFMNQWPAFGATLLFSTQPLLFGHAFINPKDIPFMSFFLATIASGLWMADSQKNGDEEVNSSKFNKLFVAIARDWDSSRSAVVRILTRIGTTILIGTAIFFARDGINLVLSGVIDYVLIVDPATPLGKLAGRVAENSGEIATERYIERGTLIFWQIYSFLIGGIIFSWLFVLMQRFRHTGSELWSGVLQPYLREFDLSLLKKIWGNLSNPKLIFAGIILGICTSIRVIGPAAGGLVAIYLIFQWRHHSVATIIAYFSVGALVTYIFWPFLWEAPFSRFAESMSLMANFPWEGKVLFDGVLYNSTELPGRYLPTLLLLQFTEPTMLLFFGGLIIAIYFAITNRKNPPGLVLLLLWFWTPTLFIIISRPPVYDNFRQFLFIIPPIFVFSGIFLDAIYKKLKHKWMFIIIIAGVITPGVYSSIKLHPYEYIYYNRFVRGLEGAFRNYELDYWATSYKEAMEYVNQISEPNAR